MFRLPAYEKKLFTCFSSEKFLRKFLKICMKTFVLEFAFSKIADKRAPLPLFSRELFKILRTAPVKIGCFYT